MGRLCTSPQRHKRHHCHSHSQGFRTRIFTVADSVTITVVRSVKQARVTFISWPNCLDIKMNLLAPARATHDANPIADKNEVADKNEDGMPGTYLLAVVPEADTQNQGNEKRNIGVRHRQLRQHRMASRHQYGTAMSVLVAPGSVVHTTYVQPVTQDATGMPYILGSSIALLQYCTIPVQHGSGAAQHRLPCCFKTNDKTMMA